VTRSPPAPPRAVIFTDVNGPVSATLVQETIRLARRERLLEVAALVVSDRASFQVARPRRQMRVARRLAAWLLDDRVPLSSVREAALDLDAVERRLGIPVLVPDGGDPNDAQFVRSLRLAFEAHVALCFYCLRIFRRPLLEAFEQCVNYHDSLLPRHRGLLATSFSIYAGDGVTGFTFHRMDESIDGGPILVQGAVPVGEDEHLLSIKQRKLAAAVAALPDALRMIAGGAPGRTQVGAGEYHSRRAIASLLHVARPEEIESAELARRLRSFGIVDLTIDGLELPVTRLRPSRPGRRLAFRTGDGAVLEPDRLVGLPVPLYRLMRTVYRPAVAPAPAVDPL
jgi:folate-dependent phosphoribosylglycinamide formyltransferase PurN